ncbi:MAG: DNA repair protein RadA, partial [Lawsonibacter sp.]
MKAKTLFYCTECGNEFPKWQGKCSACGAWNTVVESPPENAAKKPGSSRARGSGLGVSVHGPRAMKDVE